MAILLGIDWAELFGFSVPISEMIIRGTAIYWFLFIVFRFVIPRDVGAIGIADILILVIIADASQNAMSGDYKTITDGMVLIAVMVGWNLAFDRFAFYFPAFRRFATPASLCLVKDGRMLKRNMRREFITDDELWGHLRMDGVESLDQVRAAYLESDGGFSVIKKAGSEHHNPHSPSRSESM
ncbi:DUF421 domain-containing protein [Herminiimonas fonticola]|uniref:Uncharacterized protein DUF421 n=1 Tax=Herminiimonas fonticola TaxID=303380 RepID=A0A4R6GJG2_9BURK|nr:YetF domain-containing protein [Herminiimonas fonticola]RBA25457.1 Protein of unknown function (DUF421) [Herminiimonas fonticola]TDN94570.1 uncharacterized protein DUF421 [Herminiimonas fonticola]